MVIATLCKYDLRKGDLFVLSWARVRRVEYLVRADNVWWRCAQYFVIASCGYMPRDNKCMYMAHVCFYVCCSECVLLLFAFRDLWKEMGLYIYIYHYEHYGFSFLDLTNAIFCRVSLFCIHFHFCKYTLTDSFDDRRSQFNLI